MLRSLKEIIGYRLQAKDDEFGKVRDFLFDDREWIVRYVVADTRNWLPGQKVVIPPKEAGTPDWSGHELPLSLTREEVKSAPPLDEHEPVSRKHEEALHNYFEWQPYWFGGNVPRGTLKPGQERIGEKRDPEPALEKREARAESHLRSMDTLLGYTIEAADGEIGHVDDMIFEDDTWAIRYVVVDTRNLLPGRRVLLASAWISRIDADLELLKTDLSRKTVKHSPEFDPSAPVNRRYEEILYDYYGRPRYWA